MLKIIGVFVLGVVVVLFVVWNSIGGLMFFEQFSFFMVEEMIVCIQQNIQGVGNGWLIFGLCNLVKLVEVEGGNVLLVLFIEVCSLIYLGFILKDDKVCFFFLLMFCKIFVYKKGDGKVYIGYFNVGLIGCLFGLMVGGIMDKVVVDQQKFFVMDLSKLVLLLIVLKMGGEGGSGVGVVVGC